MKAQQIFQTYQSDSLLRVTSRPLKKLRSTLNLSWYSRPVLEWIVAGVNNLIARLRLEEPEDILSRTFELITVDRNQIGNAIMEHVDRYVYSRGECPHRVLVGRDQWAGIQGELRDHLMFGVSLTFPRGREMRMQYLGLTVVLIPWMNGILCIPDIASPDNL